MIEKIIFSMVAFVLFTYIFLFKLIKRNDTNYLIILISQAIGITINFVQIIFNFSENGLIKVITYLLCIIIPSIILIFELNGINFSEIMSYIGSKFFLLIGNKKIAKNILVNLVTKYKDSYIGHKMLAKIYESEGGMRKAIDEYVKVLDLKKDDYKSYYTISVLLNDLGKKSESIEMLENLIKVKPEFYKATVLLADLLCQTDKYKEAINVYMEALKYYPENYEIYYELGIIYTKLNDFQMAKDFYEQAAELNHNLYNAHYKLGQISLLYRDLDAAEESFSKALYEENESDAYFQLSKIYIMKNQREKAIIFLNKSIELDPVNYKKAKEEPIFFGVKKQIKKPEAEAKKQNKEKSKKETEIEEYLENTYNITKKIDLDETSKYGIKINEFKWQKGTKTQKERIDPN